MKIAFDVDVLAKQSMDTNILNSHRIQGSIHFTNIHCSQKNARGNTEKH